MKIHYDAFCSSWRWTRSASANALASDFAVGRSGHLKRMKRSGRPWIGSSASDLRASSAMRAVLDSTSTASPSMSSAPLTAASIVFEASSGAAAAAAASCNVTSDVLSSSKVCTLALTASSAFVAPESLSARTRSAATAMAASASAIASAGGGFTDTSMSSSSALVDTESAVSKPRSVTSMYRICASSGSSSAHPSSTCTASPPSSLASSTNISRHAQSASKRKVLKSTTISSAPVT
mmetsp:Transcript_1336/g.4836  ORF Transcript_1336/g.4836 Transcript_1336/m.4836 type:complete len:237 (+) Transcript_1336:67-777(+)